VKICGIALLNQAGPAEAGEAGFIAQNSVLWMDQLKPGIPPVCAVAVSGKVNAVLNTVLY
jgi:hypothetical protein